MSSLNALWFNALNLTHGPHRLYEPLYIDAIIKQAACTPAEVSAHLTSLELKGAVKNLGGNIYQRLA